MFLLTRLEIVYRNIIVTAFSILFYFLGAGAYVVVLVFVIVTNYWFGLLLAKSRKKSLLVFMIAVDLLPLALLKYGNFLIENANAMFAFGTPINAISLLLPAGISFFTFQGISYVVDVYSGKIDPSRSLLQFATYKSMFPQLVAGPIVRYAEIERELKTPLLSLARFNAGIFYFGIGLARKTLIADPLGRQVDQIYALPAEAVTTATAWIATACYTLQIFFDFAGYSEMAIGLGLMMGFTFPENFRQPYRSRTITEFWRRWHMTLSAWFRDYLYIPLGGNRRGMWRTAMNLSLVFLLCGLWHGAAWTFVLWGAYHGALLIVERVLRTKAGFEARGLLGMAVTLLLVAFGWVLFRAESLGQAWSMMSKMLFLDTSGTTLLGASFYLSPHIVTVLLVGSVLALAPLDKLQFRRRLLEGQHTALAGLIGTVLTFLAVGELAANGFNPFIYFQF